MLNAMMPSCPGVSGRHVADHPARWRHLSRHGNDLSSALSLTQFQGRRLSALIPERVLFLGEADVSEVWGAGPIGWRGGFWGGRGRGGGGGGLSPL